MKKMIASATPIATLLATLSAALLVAGSAYAAAGGPGRYAFNKGNVAGWSMMTPEERTEHRNKMHGMKTYDECKSYQEEHHKLMEARAKEKGVTLPNPRQNACDRMKAKGFIK